MVFTRLLDRLAVRRPVRLLESLRATVPLAVGWLRPVILLPVWAATGLTPQQLEAVLAHELAHVRRLDCFVQILAAAAETLLFYHPAVWWVSRTIRQESEHCCDDLAVGTCGDRRGYACALARAAELGILRSRAARGDAAFTAAATGGKLLPRIRRLFGAGNPRALSFGQYLSGALALAAVIAIAIAVGVSCSAEDALRAKPFNVIAIVLPSVRLACQSVFPDPTMGTNYFFVPNKMEKTIAHAATAAHIVRLAYGSAANTRTPQLYAI